MPKFTVTTREKYTHRTTYVFDAPSAADAVRMVKAGVVEDYDSTSIDADWSEDEFLGVVEVLDADDNEVKVEEPPPNRTRMVFEIVTTKPWSEAGVRGVTDEFVHRYGGNLNVASAGLVKFEDIHVEEEG